MLLYEYKKWFYSKSIIFKWFLILILLRPFIDIFEEFKEKFLFISPGQAAGVLTPLLVIISLWFVKSKIIKLNAAGILFLCFGFLLTINGILFFFNGLTLGSAGFALKLTIPFYLFIYLIFFIDSADDLDGILFTILVSSAFPLFMLLYEIIFQPLVIYVEPGKGLLRYIGLYPDAINYSIYLLLSFFIAAYFYLKSKNNFYLVLISILIIFIIIALSYISHFTSYITFLFLFLFFLVFSFKTNRKRAFCFLLLFLIAGLFQYHDKIEEKIDPLYRHDIEVIKGEADLRHGFNSRFGIWQDHLYRFNELPFYAKLFGAGFNGNDHEFPGVDAGAHNDFIRILLASGITGLLAYLIFLVLILKTSLKFSRSLKYLIIGTILIILIYSVALTPTFYYPLMYLMLSVFGFISKINISSTLGRGLR